jgi:hypothetical protein
VWNAHAFWGLCSQVAKVGTFTASIVDGLRERLFQLQAQAKDAETQPDKDSLDQVGLLLACE